MNVYSVSNTNNVSNVITKSFSNMVTYSADLLAKACTFHIVYVDLMLNKIA